MVCLIFRPKCFSICNISFLMSSPSAIPLGGPLSTVAHVTCSSHDTLWLPKGCEGQYNGELAPHRYCRTCGLVKVEGNQKGHRVGYYYALLGQMKSHLEREKPKRKLTATDIQLICQEIRRRDLFTDPYGSPCSSRDKEFIEIVLAKRSDINLTYIS